jgi:serine/threonine protein kinase
MRIFILICSLICFELPSKQTLASYLEEKKEEVTQEMVCSILTNILEAIHYLSSNDIVHEAIVPENIYLLFSNKVR